LVVRRQALRRLYASPDADGSKIEWAIQDSNL